MQEPKENPAPVATGNGADIQSKRNATSISNHGSARNLIEFASLMPAVAEKLLGEPNHALSQPTRGELRYGNRGSLSVDCNAGIFCDHEANVGGGVLDLIGHKLGVDHAEAMLWLRSEGLLSEPARQKPALKVVSSEKSKVVATYDYTDLGGQLLFQVVRFEPKDFRQRRPDGKGDWTWKVGKETPRFLYRAPQVSAAIDAGKTIYVVEGEKDVHALEAAGMVATCNAGGAGKWRTEYTEFLRGARVIVIPDNDDAGVRHARDVTRKLGGIASDAVLLVLDVPVKGDVSDWLAAGNMVPGKGDVVDWRAAGENIKEARPDSELGEQVANRVHEFIGRFVAYPTKEARDANTLWILHTHLMEHWDSTPRIAFLSPEPGSGKTRALEVMEHLVPRAVLSVNTSPAYLFRKIGAEEGPPTILFDEIDTLFGPKAKDNEDVRGVLNAGHRRGATAGRCVVVGKTVTTEELPAYCAVALSGLGWLPDTIMQRSVIVRMRKRLQTERVEPWRGRLCKPQAEPIYALLQDWARTVDQVEWPELPPTIQDRDADVWEPLVAIADIIGGSWPKRSRDAALALLGAREDAGPSFGVRLLTDIKSVFASEHGDALTSKELAQKLVALDESPWADLRGKPLDAEKLARRLRDFSMKPKQHWFGEKQLRGYARADFQDAWSRYLPPTPAEAVTPVTGVTEPQPGASNPSRVTPEPPENPYNSGVVTGVTGVTGFPGNGGDGSAGVTGVTALRVCDHCRRPGTADDPLLQVSDAGRELRLHNECIGQPIDDGIPDFLRRTGGSAAA